MVNDLWAKATSPTNRLSSQGHICWGASIPETAHIHFLPAANALENSSNAPKLQRNGGGEASSRNFLPSLSLAVNHPASITPHCKPQMCGERQGELLLAKERARLTKTLEGVAVWGTHPELPHFQQPVAWHFRADASWAGSKFLPRDFFFLPSPPPSTFPSPAKLHSICS